MKAVKGRFYFGGIHPRGNKELSKDCPLEVMPLPEEVAVKYEDLAASLAVLGKKLEDNLRKEE